jgi:hypothetical protein
LRLDYNLEFGMCWLFVVQFGLGLFVGLELGEG